MQTEILFSTIAGVALRRGVALVEGSRKCRKHVHQGRLFLPVMCVCDRDPILAKYDFARGQQCATFKPENGSKLRNLSLFLGCFLRVTIDVFDFSHRTVPEEGGQN